MDDINILERPNSLTFEIVIIGSTKVTYHKYAILNLARLGIEARQK